MTNATLYRYPGPRPFQDTHVDRLLFFGREHERQSLLHMVLAERLVVLYAKSGLGKTSLINAGLMKPLREKNFLPFRVTFTDTEVNPLQAVYSKIADIVEEYKVDHKPGERGTLWQFFKTAEFWSYEDILLIPVLVLDQFEELFTLHSADKRSPFITELADLIRGRIPKDLMDSLRSDEILPYGEKPPEIKVVISIREDFLGQLEEMSQQIPDILSKRFRLLSLQRDQAREAVTKPAQVEDAEIRSTKFIYTPESVDAMLDFLCQQKGRDKITIADEVEPFQLQVLCQHIESTVLTKQKDEGVDLKVEKSDLGGEEGMQRVLKDFYNNQIEQLGSFWIRTRVRRLFEDRLISETNRRLSLEEEQIERRAKVRKSVLSKLVDNRLLRAEPRVGSVYYELSHDALIEPIRKAHRELKRKHRVIAALIVLLVTVVPYITISEYTARREVSEARTRVDAFEKDGEGRGEKTKGGERSDLANINPYKDLAFIYAKRENYEKAFEACERAAQKGTAPARLWPDFFEALTIDKNEAQAARVLEVASGFNSRDPKYYYHLALEFYRLKKYDKEIENYEKAIQLNPQYADAYAGLGAALQDHGKSEDAIKNYQKAIQLNPNLAFVYNSLGNLFYNKGNYEEARKNYEQVIKLDPKGTYAYTNLGNVFWRQKNYEKALTNYKNALALDPNYAPAHNGLGNILRDQGKHEDAIENYHKAIQLNPNLVDAYNNLGTVFHDQKKYDEAIQHYRKAISLDQKYSLAYSNLGYLFREKKMVDEAIKNFQKAIELNPNNVSAYKGLGFLFYSLKNDELAIENYQKAIALDPKDAEIYHDLGVIYFERKHKYPEAYKMFEKAFANNPHDISNKACLAEASLGVARFDKASTLAREVLNEKGASPAERLAMHLTVISSSILLDKRAVAYTELRYLATYVRSLPKDFEQRWTYGGFKNFIETTDKLNQFDKELIRRLTVILESPMLEVDQKIKEFELSYPEIFKQG